MLAKCCTVLVALVAALVGLVVSGKFAEWELLPRFVEATGNQIFVGWGPAFLRKDELQAAFKFTDVKDGSLKGKTALVTGANSGLGYWTSLHLARAGATTIMACRSEKKCKEAVQSIKDTLKERKVRQYGDIQTSQVDVASLQSVRAFTKSLNEKPIDILVLNAGYGIQVYEVPVAEATDKHRLTDEGIEKMYATNVMGHFLMVQDLVPNLKAAADKNKSARVVFVSSASGYTLTQKEFDDAFQSVERFNKKDLDMSRYAITKAVQVLHARELHKLLPSNIYVNACHPGAVSTNIWDNMMTRIHQSLQGTFAETYSDKVEEKLRSIMNMLFWTGEDGALTQFFLAASPKVESEKINGQYLHPVAKVVNMPPVAQDNVWKENARVFWNLAKKMLEMNGFE